MCNKIRVKHGQLSNSLKRKTLNINSSIHFKVDKAWTGNLSTSLEKSKPLTKMEDGGDGIVAVVVVVPSLFSRASLPNARDDTMSFTRSVTCVLLNTKKRDVA